MHEISLVRNIFATIEAQHPDIPPECIQCIYLQVGELSNVEPIAMQNAFEAVIENDIRYQHAMLEITVTPVLIYCDDCDKTSSIKNYHFVCSCGKPSKKMVQGDELLITRIEYVTAPIAACEAPNQTIGTQNGEQRTESAWNPK